MASLLSMQHTGFSLEVITSHGHIVLDVIRSARRTFQLSVIPDGRILLRAPLGANDNQFQDLVRRKSAWIIRARDRMSRQARKMPTPDYTDGACFHVFGEEKVLKVIESDRGRPFFESTQEGWSLQLPRSFAVERRIVTARQALKIWADRKVLDHFSQRVSFWSREMGVRLPVINVRRQRRLWGSCNSRSRSLSFNRALIAFPPVIVDYVVIHELCHLAFPDHSARFWAEVERWCPDWRKHRRWLKVDSLQYCAP